MKYLEDKNQHERDVYIKFNEEKHEYKVADLKLSSVSSVIHNFFSEFDADLVIDNMMKSPKWSENKLFGKTKEEIKEIWKTNSEIAMDAGSKLHADIEDYLNYIAIDNHSIEFQFFLNFMRDKIPNVYRTEWKIYIEENINLAGTIDMAAIDEKNKNSIVLYDWKRSKQIRYSNNYGKSAIPKFLSHLSDSNFSHYSLQLNLYKYILEHAYNKKVSAMYLVCLHPDNRNENYMLYEVRPMTEDIHSIIEHIKNNK